MSPSMRQKPPQAVLQSMPRGTAEHVRCSGRFASLDAAELQWPSSQEILFVISYELSRQCHVIAMPLQSYCHTSAMSLPCHCHAITMLLPNYYHVFVTWLPC